MEAQIMDRKLKEKLANLCVLEQVSDEEFWIDLSTIAKEIELPVNELEELVIESEDFLINKEGKLTTRKLYREKTPFIKKLLHSFVNQID